MNTSTYIKNPDLARPWVYFLTTFAWTWSFFGLAYCLGLNGESSILGTVLVFFAIGGPAIIAALFIYLALDREGQRDYWRRIIDYRRISAKWYLVIFLLFPTVSILAAFLSGYWNSSLFFTNKLPSVLLLVLVVPLAPTLEELGWRGYALDRLQERHGILTSSLVLGGLWFLWHFPAFFLPGSMLGAMPVASPAFWLYMINIVALSVCFTWIYNSTGRSTLAAILFHLMIEFSVNKGLVPYEQPEHVYNVALWVIIAAIIAALYGVRKPVSASPNNLTRPY